MSVDIKISLYDYDFTSNYMSNLVRVFGGYEIHINSELWLLLITSASNFVTDIHKTRLNQWSLLSYTVCLLLTQLFQNHPVPHFIQIEVG